MRLRPIAGFVYWPDRLGARRLRENCVIQKMGSLKVMCGGLQTAERLPGRKPGPHDFTYCYDFHEFAYTRRAWAAVAKRGAWRKFRSPEGTAGFFQDPRRPEEVPFPLVLS